MKELKMQDYSLMPLTIEDTNNTYGGEWPSWVKGIGWVALGKEIIDHWDELKKGFTNGWNDAK